MLIDTHTHVVSPDEDRFPRRRLALANGAWWDSSDCSVEAFVDPLDASPTDGVVLVQAAGAYGDDNTYVAEAVTADRQRFVASCIVDPTAPVDPVEALRTWTKRDGIEGVRLFHIPTPSPAWVDAALGDSVIDSAADLGLAISICCQAWDLPAVGRQLARRPDVDFTLDHCGFPDFSGGAPFAHAQPLWDLAGHANLFLKFTPTCAHVSVEDSQAGADPDIDDPASILTTLVDRFGAGRVVWGSDWPQHRQLHPEHDPAELRYLTYAEQVEMIAGWADGLAAEGRAAFLGGTALRQWPTAWPHLRD